VATGQLCMSLHRLGITTATVGSAAGSVGSVGSGRFALVGMLAKSTQGLCLRV
jgi:hypothetical protein